MLNREALKAAYNYAVLTRGDLFGDVSNPERWMDRFAATAELDYDSISNFLMPQCYVVDIGCGMGAVDVIAMQRLGVRVTLFDGEEADARVEQQDMPFMSRRVVEAFVRSNAVLNWQYRNVQQFEPHPVDVVISMRSWCFHYPPSLYLSKVVACDPTWVIVDVRRERPAWREELEQAFRFFTCVSMGQKWDRLVFRRK